MQTYIIKCGCTKIINADSIEEAEKKVVNDLTLGYDCEEAEVLGSELLK